MWSPHIFLLNVFENNICSPSLMFLKIISAAWEVFCGVSLRSILNPADSSKHWLSAHSLNILLLGDHFVFPEACLILWKRVITWRSYPPQTNNAKNLRKKTRLCDFDWGGGGGWELLLVTWPQKSSRLPAELLSQSDGALWPPETSCFELFPSTSPDAGFLLKVKWLLIV